MSLDYLNPQSNLKAIGMFIFGGSASIGTMSAGFHLDKVLEMTDDMAEKSAYHWTKNFKNIPIVAPNEWENEEYLAKVKAENYDILFSNCPCSSLSQINRYASVDGKNNEQFYRVFNAIVAAQPKTFFIENAPTLVKFGYPILKDMVDKLKDTYKFTIIRDYGGNHGVAMKRMRTLVIGWRKDLFDNKLRLLQMNQEPRTTTKDVIGDLYDYPVGDPRIKNHTIVKNDTAWCEVEHLFNYVPHDTSALLTFIAKWNEIGPLVTNDKVKREVERRKADLEAGKRLWDKTPWRISETNVCPSMTSVTRIIHPVNNRTFTIREYSRLMGYPDDFEWFPNECKVEIIQNIAQGVPAPFVKYVTSEIKEALLNNRPIINDTEDKVLCFQHHTKKKYKALSFKDLNEMNQLEADKSFENLEK